MHTSGVLLVAKNEEVYKELQRQFAAREVRKIYVAVLDGDTLFTISGLITTIMGECREPVEADLLKQPFGDYLGRLSNLLMRKLYLIDIQNKRVKDEQN